MKIKILPKTDNILLQNKNFDDIIKLSNDIKNVERIEIKWERKENYFVNMDQ